MSPILRSFIRWNIRCSNAFDRLLPEDYRVDGNSDFRRGFVDRWLRPGVRIADIGGGKNPFINAGRKVELGAYVTGIDISASELANAPVGAYDATVCADIGRYQGTADADLCICQAVLEHVQDVEAAFHSIAGTLKVGGVALIFVPSRNAVFARLNLLLPEGLKRWMLHTIFPQSASDQGFRSYYDRCTPRDFTRLAAASGMVVEEARHYYVSAYFTFLVPLHMVWRAWVVLFRRVAGTQADETFSMALRKVT